MPGAKAICFCWLLAASYGICSAVSKFNDITTYGPEDGTLEELRNERLPPPKPRKTLRYRVVSIPVEMWREEVRPGCHVSAYIPRSDQVGEFVTRIGSFITPFDISWQDCGNHDEFIVFIDGKVLHLPNLKPITRPLSGEMLIFGAIDFPYQAMWNVSENLFSTTNQFAWDVKRYALLNMTMKGVHGNMIGYSRNEKDSYHIVDDIVYGLTENSAASQTIVNLMKIIPNYWLLKFIFSLFDNDLESSLKVAIDWFGDMLTNIYFFTTRGFLLFLAMYYITRMVFGDSYVGLGTAAMLANAVRLSGSYE